MSKEINLVSHAATVIPVSDMAKSLSFYEDKLGFSRAFAWNDPIDYAVLKRNDVAIHLALTKDSINPSFRMMYIFVHDVTAFFEELTLRGVKIPPPKTTEYGMSELEVKDPDGHILSFGKAD